jgi:hypothetical protein
MTETSAKAKRQAARQSALEREQRQRTLRIAAVVIVVVVVLGGLIYWVANETIKGTNEWAVRPTAHPNEQIIPDEGRGHVETGSQVNYQHYPPSSGQHFPIWADPGFYDQPVADGYWVHSLEHGDVVVLYNCEATSDCEGLKTEIRNFVNSAPTHGCDKPRLMAMPYSRGLSTPVSIVAWGVQLDLPAFDGDALLNFYKRYENRGPEQVGCP